MIATDLLERLTQNKTLGSAPREELAWLVENASLRTLNTGETLSHKGQPVEALYVILSGRLALFVDRGAGPNKLIEWREGDVTGMLPYSRLVSPPGDTIVQETLEILVLHRDHFRAMVRECFSITSMLVHLMLDRTRLFTSTELQDEKMISLGKLSAGLAHELNNPASAIERNACALMDRLEGSESAVRALGRAGLSDVQLDAVDAIRTACQGKKPLRVRSPLEQLDREDAIAAWLVARGLDASNALILADTEVTIEELNRVVGIVDGPALNALLRWAATGCAVRRLASEIGDSATHISMLVMAIKGFTHMDKAMVAEPVDLELSLNNTVTVLQSKAREKSIAVAVKLPADLPRIYGFAAELSQIWGNLLDNALDAVSNGGHVEVSANLEGQRVAVRILDDGPGIPEGVRSRIFDPFFTTKPMGQGTGLGLDIVRRLVRHNDGAIDFESRPGRTEFQVSLPITNSGSSSPAQKQGA